jgi:hypothetical protein
MSDNPLDRIPSFDRISLRAVVVAEGEDPGPALTAAGITDPIALPIVFGESPPDRTFGDGFTPNVPAVLEFDEPEVDASDSASGTFGSASDIHASSAGAQAGAAGAVSDDMPPSRPVTTNLPGAYDIQSLAPVRSDSKTKRHRNRSMGAPPDLSSVFGSTAGLPGARIGLARSATYEAPPPESTKTTPTAVVDKQPFAPDC